MRDEEYASALLSPVAHRKRKSSKPFQLLMPQAVPHLGEPVLLLLVHVVGNRLDDHHGLGVEPVAVRIERGGRLGTRPGYLRMASTVFFSAEGCAGERGAFFLAVSSCVPRSLSCLRPSPSRTFGNQSDSSSSM